MHLGTLSCRSSGFSWSVRWEYDSCFQRELLKKLWLVEKLTQAEMFSFSVTPSSQITKLIKKLFLKQRITQSFVVPFTRKTCSIERSLRFAVERDSPVIFVSVCGKYLKIASYGQISELLVEESFLKITLCINFKLQKTSTFLLSPLFMYYLKQTSGWHLTNCLLLILLLLYRCSKSFHTSFSENI